MTIRFDSLVPALAVLVAIGLLSPLTVAEAATRPGWRTAQLVVAEDQGEYPSPQVSVDEEGNAIIVWMQDDGVRCNISSVRYEVGRGWGTSQLIENDDTGDALYPKISSDRSGNAIAIWHQSVDRYDGFGNPLPPNRFDIWSNRYDVGTGWGHAQLIETDDSGQSYDPQVATDASGNATAAWRQSSQIWSNRYVAGIGWGAAETIGECTQYALSPQVSVDDSGNAIVVWSTYETSGNWIWSNRYDTETGWRAAEFIEASDSEWPAFWPRVSMDSSGNAIAVWSQDRYDGVYCSDIWSNRFVVGSGWGTAEVIETDTSADAQYPVVSTDGSGNAIAVWSLYENRDPRNSTIWANRYDVGTGWGTAELLQPGGEREFAIGSQVSVDRSGNATAMWSKGGDDVYSVWAARYVVGTGWGAPELVETNDTEDAAGAQISADDLGNVIAVWSQSSQIWSNRYVVADNEPLVSDGTAPLMLYAFVFIATVVAVTIAVLVHRKLRAPPKSETS